MKKVLLILMVVLIVTHGNAQTKPHWLQIEGKPVHDIRDFGAKVDGITDDTAAVQAAVDYVYKLPRTYHGGGGAVFIPSGVTRITGRIKLRSSSFTDIVGTGMYSSKIFADGASAGFELARDSSFKKLTIYGAASAKGVGAVATCGLIIGGSNTYIEDVHVYGFETGVLLRDAYLTRISRVRVRSCENGIVLVGSTDVGFGSGTTPCQDITIDNVSISNSYNALRLGGTRGLRFSGGNIERNVFGVIFEGTANRTITITDIWIEDAFYPLYFNQSSGVTQNIKVTNCEVWLQKNASYVPDGLTLADAEFIRIESSTGGIRMVILDNNLFLLGSGAAGTVAIGKSAGANPLQSARITNNLWQVPTKGDGAPLPNTYHAENDNLFWFEQAPSPMRVTNASGTYTMFANGDIFMRTILEDYSLDGTPGTMATTLVPFPYGGTSLLSDRSGSISWRGLTSAAAVNAAASTVVSVTTNTHPPRWLIQRSENHTTATATVMLEAWGRWR